tara:strand:- start:263 stop:520 length:258 start_codon:yes stop_codon:yes gene_type:complete
MPKQRLTVWMPKYMPSDEERKYYEHGIKNNIRISPYPTTSGPNPKEWYIEIFSKNKWVRSPSVYNEQTIWPEFYKMYKYYYDKHR